MSSHRTGGRGCRLARCTEVEGVRAHLTQTDRLGQVKLENGHLVTGTRLAEQTSAVTAAEKGKNPQKEIASRGLHFLMHS